MLEIYTWSSTSLNRKIIKQLAIIYKAKYQYDKRYDR